MNKKLFLELLLVLSFTVGVAFFYFHTQKVIDYTSCKLCDAHDYIKVYNYFKGDSSEYKVPFPISGRILVPFIGSLLPFDVITSFQLINFIFLLLSVTVIYVLWRKLNFSFYLIGIGLFWLLFHWVGIVRFNQYDPIGVDLPVYFFHTLVLFVFLSKNYKWLWVLGPVAVLQKESITAFILLLFIYLMIVAFIRKEKIYINIDVLIALILCIVVKTVCSYYYPAIRPDQGSLKSALFWARQSLLDPMRIPRWFVAIFFAFGFLILLCFKKIKREHICNELGGFLFLTTLAALILGLIGGFDNTRITYLGFPFIMTFILWVLKDAGLYSVAASFLLSIPFMMLLTNLGSPQDSSWGAEYIDWGNLAGWGIYIVGGGFVLDRLDFFKKIIFNQK